MRLYVDGALQAAGTGPAGTRSAPAVLRIGGLQSGGGFLDGAISEVNLFNYVLNAAQVADLYSPQPPPWPWQVLDVGKTGSDGYALFDPKTGVWTVGGGGTDIGLTSDQFQFTHQLMPGDGTLVARLNTAALNSDGTFTANAKAGLMFRDSGAADAPFVGVFHSQTVGLQMLYRDLPGASAAQESATVSLNTPCWLKLSRAGDTFTAAYATTAGTPAVGDWIQIGSHTTILTTNSLVGMAVCAYDNSRIASATLTGVVLQPASPGDTWRLQWFGTTANAGDAADAADPDLDGLSNLLERACNLNPTVADAEGVSGAVRSGMFELHYRRNLSATDLSYQVQWSPELKTWSTNGVVDSVLSSDGATEQRAGGVPVDTASPIFLRLQITPN